MRHSALRSAAAGLLVLGAAGAIGAQQTSLQVLKHHVRPQVASRQATFAGYLPPDQQLQMSIVLPLRNQPDLTSLLGRLYDKTDPAYRKFLSVAQFTDQFGPTISDYQAVVAFAQANGFTVTSDPANRLIVPITGTVAQVNQAFHVMMTLYQHPSENRIFFSPDREPSLQLSIPVTHIAGLDSYSLPQPMVHRPTGAGPNGLPLAAVLGSGPGGSYLGSDMRAAYYGGSTLDGTGQSIGLVEFGGYLLSDVSSTFTSAGQTYNVPVNNVLLNGVSLSPAADDAEQVLDIVQAIGMAPGLGQVRVYIAPNAAGQDPAILNAMASENLVKLLSCSWGWQPADPTVDDVFFQEMAAQGQSFFTASGDSGAFDVAISPFFYPAEDQFVTTVGGTHLTTTAAAGAWTAETVWNSSGAGSGGGISPDNISIPSWQTGLANSANGGSNTLRNEPDVAMEGDFDNYACALGSCASDYAGTSFAAPRWAGFMALINQQAVEAQNAPLGGVGFLNPALYAIGEGTKASNDLHDITVGNNDTKNQPVFFTAVSGYDLTTGWGSPTGQSFIDDIAGPQIPGFWIASSASTLSVAPGGSSSANIRITDAGGFTGNVSFASVSQLPAGVTAAFSPNPATGISVLTVTAAASAVVSSTPVTITGTSGTLSATSVVIIAVNTPTFTLNSSTQVTTYPGASVAVAVAVTPLYGFTGSVNLSATGLPSGVTASFSPATTTGTSTLTLTASSSVAVGMSTVTITGVSGSITKTTAIALTIVGPSFQLYGAGSVSIGQGSSSGTYVYVYNLDGFAGNVNFAVSGLPSGVTASFSPNPSSSTTQLTFTASSAAAIGFTTVTVTGTSGSLSATTTILLGVYVPSFTIFTTGSVSLAQGSTSAASVSVSAQYGFSGNVKFTVAGLPAGVTVLWNPNPTTTNTVLTFIASSTLTPGSYPLTITGTSGSLSATAPVVLSVNAPTFTLSNQGTVNVGQGSSGYQYVYVSSLYGFTGSVNMAVSGLPVGVTASFSPNPTNYSTDLTLTALIVAPVGQYTVTVTGTSGNQTATTTFPLAIYAPTFTLSTYGSVALGQGTSGNAYVYVNAQYGFNSPVTLSVSGMPSGMTASFASNPATGSSLLTLSASAAVASGAYTLTISGTAAGHTATTTLAVTVAAPSFTITDYGSVTLGQGTSATSSVYVTGANGFAGNVNLSVSGLPSGVTASFSPNPATSGNTSVLTLTASPGAALGQYTLTITGTSGNQTAITSLPLTIGAPAFTLSSAGSATVVQGTSTTSYVYLYPAYGFTGSVSLAASGLPSGVTASFSANPTTGTYDQLTLTASSSAPAGTNTVTITGTFGTLTETTTLALTVAAPSFTLYSYSSSMTLNQGSSATDTFVVEATNGFGGNVTFTATGLPSGVTASFSPNPTTYSTTLTLTASNTAAAGNATVTIVGTSGGLSVSTPVTLTVNPNSFALLAAPSRVTLVPGGVQKAVLQLVDQNGFSSGVNLTVSGLPAGVTAAFSANPLTSAGNLILTASNAATAGTSTVTVTGTSGALTANATLLVAIGASQASTTTLALVSGAVPVSSVAAGTVVKAIASVSLGSGPLTAGQVNFCDATAAYCDATHLFGTAQLTGTGNATLVFVPGPGKHSLRAVFAGTNAAGVSASNGAALTVTSALPTTTTLAATGSTGNYTLTATVTGNGPFAPTGTVSFLDTSYSNTVLGQALLGSGTAATSWSSVSSPALSATPNSIATGDFNGDGIPDLVTVNGNAGVLTVLLGQGNGTFQATPTPVVTASSPAFVAVGDFNRDGKADLAVAMSNSSSITFFLGNGDGTFTPSSLSPQTGSDPVYIAVGDFNNDGLQDLAVSNYYAGTITVLLGQGDGTFLPVAASPATGSYPQNIAITDFNDDGIQDLAVINQSTSSVTILIGNGDGTFTPIASPSAGSNVQGLAVADFNQDGKPDLVVTNFYSSTATVLLGNGDGTFTPAPAPATGYSPSALATADFNGDGKPDMAVVNGYGNTVTLLLGNGDGTFTTAGSIAAPSFGALLVGDWNLDGIPDLAGVNGQTYAPTALMTQRSQKVTASATGISAAANGAHLAEASYPGDSSFSGSISGKVQLAGSGLQTISFPQPLAGTAGQSAALLATASSGLPVTFAVVSGPATLSGANNATVTYTGAGTVVIAASQAGNASYAAATAVSVSITVYNDSIWVANAASAPSMLSEVGTGLLSAGPKPASSLAGGIAADASGNIWYVGGDNALYVTNSSSRSNTYSNGGLNQPDAIAVDGAGSLWIANAGSGTVSEFLNTGVPVTGSAGYSATAAQAPAASQGAPRSIAIDSSGDVWIANKTGNSVTHMFGAAAPVMTPLSSAVVSGVTGVKP